METLLSFEGKKIQEFRYNYKSHVASCHNGVHRQELESFLLETIKDAWKLGNDYQEKKSAK